MEKIGVLAHTSTEKWQHLIGNKKCTSFTTVLADQFNCCPSPSTMKEQRPTASSTHANMDDRISCLSDNLLHQIISGIRNPLHRVRTSVLSRRWRYLPISHPDLNFICDPWHNPDKIPLFCNFIRHVLTHREPVNVRKLQFNSYAHLDAELARECIRYAVVHNVEILRLRLSCNSNIDCGVLELRSCLLGCESLRVLEIIDYVGSVKLPSLLNLPALRVLNLSSISFVDFNFDGRMLSGCPGLEVLKLTNCYFTCLDISAPQMTKLEITFVDTATALDVYGHDIIDHPNLCEHKVVASLPKLCSFMFHGNCSLQFYPTADLPSLSTVDIDVGIPRTLPMQFSHDFIQRMALYLINSLEHFRDTRFMTLSFSAVQVLSMIPDLEERKPLPFTSLENLNLKVDNTTVWPENVINYLSKSAPKEGCIVFELPKLTEIGGMGIF